MFDYIPSADAIATHWFQKDCVALSDDLSSYLTNDNSIVNRYLNCFSNMMFDIDRRVVFSKDYYALDVNSINQLFANIPSVLSNLNYFFDSVSSVVSSIENSILSSFQEYVPTIQWNGVDDDGHPITFFADDYGDIGYYNAVLGMLSNALISISNVRNVRFDILSVVNVDGDLVRNSFEKTFLLKTDAVSNNDELAGLKRNQNAPSAGAKLSYYDFLSSIPTELSSKIANSKSQEFSDFTATIVDVDNAGEFSLANFQNQLSVQQIEDVCNAYLSAVNYIREKLSALYRDPRLDEPKIAVVYHSGVEGIPNQRIEQQRFTEHVVKSYSDLFSLQTSLQCNGWTRFQESQTITDYFGKTIYIQDSDIDFWPVFS